MFKILSIRPLPGCKSWIYKCLRIGMMYYFCKDYIINEERTSIRRTSKYIKPLKEDFFLDQPTINISAVVGMNGDGKSSLVEMMMRLINNCAVSYKLTEGKDDLCRVEGVKAELFYLVDNVLYRMVEDEEMDSPKIWNLANLNNQNQNEWDFGEPQEVNVVENPNCFFFTLVSNYSHYAYNTHDYEKERSGQGIHWLDCIFHKNEDYQIPIALHPYREFGNIDINREYDFLRQRLLLLVLNAPNPKDQPDDESKSVRRMNHKDAEILVLTDPPYLQNSLVEFFSDVNTENKLKSLLNRDKKEKRIDSVHNWENSLIEVMTKDVGFVSFVIDIVKWLEHNSCFSFSMSSDIRTVIDELRNLNYPELSYYKKLEKKDGALVKINVAQLNRLNTIYRIMKCLDIDPSIVTKQFEELTLIEKCLCYKVYIVLTNINTYSEYKKIAGNGDVQNVFREYDERLESCITFMMQEHESYTTWKLHQIDRFLEKEKGKGTVDSHLYDEKRDEKTHRILINIDELKKKRNGKAIGLDELPPPIYEWTLLFRKEGDMTCDIDLNSFSSGEKQMLYSLSSIIYHLQNLDRTNKYPNVNLVLEEIELYYHPECQRIIVKRMLDLLHRVHFDYIKNINIVFVTHSPFVLSDVPRCNVIFLQDGMAKDIMQENTFGANIHSLLKNGFFLPNLPMGEFAYQKINSLFAELNSGNFDPETDLDSIYQRILLVGEPFLKNQLLNMYNAYKGIR